METPRQFALQGHLSCLFLRHRRQLPGAKAFGIDKAMDSPFPYGGVVPRPPSKGDEALGTNNCEDGLNRSLEPFLLANRIWTCDYAILRMLGTTGATYKGEYCPIMLSFEHNVDILAFLKRKAKL